MSEQDKIGWLCSKCNCQNPASAKACRKCGTENIRRVADEQIGNPQPPFSS